MDHFYVMRLRKWKHYFVVVLLALFAAIFLWFERDSTFSVLSTNEPLALTKGNADESNIALTFNISWGEEKVNAILEQLEKRQVQSTFFVSGEWAERHPEILEDITEAEHELGMLGYTYESYLDQDIDEVRKDLLEARDVFEKLGYEEINLLRPPSGHFDKEIIELAESYDLTVTHWNVNPHDWENPGSEKIVNTVMEQTENGDIILMHASDAVKQTDEALKTVLPGLKNKGFDFVTISELINQAHAESEMAE